MMFGLLKFHPTQPKSEKNLNVNVDILSEALSRPGSGKGEDGHQHCGHWPSGKSTTIDHLIYKVTWQIFVFADDLDVDKTLLIT